ncbi:MAG: DUF4911 domain-containing protein [Syntrophobacteria bacterium]
MEAAVGPRASVLWTYRVDPYEIHYLKFILEGYEGVATLTTLDSRAGLVRLAVPPGCEGTVEALMEAVGQEVELERLHPEGSREAAVP